MSTDNQRTDERIPVDFPVNYIHEEDYVLSFSKNISFGGMFLCTPEPLEPGIKVKLIFPAEEHYQVEVMAIVIWKNKYSKSGAIGMGVQFLSPLEPNLKESILKHVKRVEILKEFEGLA